MGLKISKNVLLEEVEPPNENVQSWDTSCNFGHIFPKIHKMQLRAILSENMDQTMYFMVGFSQFDHI